MSEVWKHNAAQKGDDVQRVRDACDIVRIVGKHLTIKPKGREYVCLCPFHDDHSPSMCVVPAKQLFHCFVCGTGGDVFRFVRLFHKMDFREALAYLAEEAGIELRPQAPRSLSDTDSTSVGRADLLAMNATAAGFFRTILNHPEHGAVAREVVERRGIRAEVSTRFLLGAAPDRWDGLATFLRSKQLGEAPATQAGLLKLRDSGGVYDAFRNRLIFPIQDSIGRVIAFGARRINDEDEPKYINSPETPVFSKSSTLYALHHAAKTIQSTRTAIVTEGYTDVIACHQGGFTNAVATLGTALTRQHAAVLRRLCDTVILLFDGDQAGERAADRAVEVFFAESLDVRVCTLRSFTSAKDPDELLKTPGGDEVFRTALAGSTDLLEYRFARLRARVANLGPGALARAMEEELATLVNLGLGEVPPVQQRAVIRQLARLSGVDEAAIQKTIPSGRRARSTPTVATTAQPVDPEHDIPALPGRPLAAADHLLGCLLCDGSLWHALAPADRTLVEPRVYPSVLHQRIAQAVIDCVENGDDPSLAAIMPLLPDGRPQDAAVALSERVDRETERDRLRAHFAHCVSRAKQEHVSSGSGDLSIIEAIELKRRQLATHGQNMRALPRPPS